MTAQDTAAPVVADYEPATQGPRWSAEAVGAEVGAHLPQGIPDLAQLRDVYLWMMASGDGDCPPSTTQLTAVDPEYGCTSSEGFWYYGVAAYSVYENTSLTGWVLSGDFEIAEPSGAQISCGGHVGIDHARDGSARVGTMLGTWRWTGADDSLSEAVSASLVIIHSGDVSTLIPDEMEVDGGLTTSAGSWTFEGFKLTEFCAYNPVGTVHIYDSRRGHWYTLELDSDCSGCGDVVFSDGRSLGRTCPDWTGLSTHLAAALGPR